MLHFQNMLKQCQTTHLKNHLDELTINALEMKILIIEDDFSLALDIEIYLKDLGYSDVRIMDDPRSTLDVVERENIELLIIDVNLEDDFSGIDLANKLQDKQIPIIFITALKDEQTFQEAMLTNPVGFLVKPFDIVTLQSCIDRLSKFKKTQANNVELDSVMLDDCFFIKQNDLLKRIEFDDILWIEADGNYIELYVHNKRYATKMSLTKVQQKMNVPYFVRAHKKFLVNIKKIDQINSSSELLINDRIIPIGLKYRAELLNKINQVDY